MGTGPMMQIPGAGQDQAMGMQVTQQPGMPPPQMPSEPTNQNYGMEDEPQDVQEDNEDNLLDYALMETNLAKKFRNKKMKDQTSLLEYMGRVVVEGYAKDEESRDKWLKANQDWLKLSLLMREIKNYPWPRASNVKYPLLATAAMQFSARAYPELVPSDGNIVKARVIPFDDSGQYNEKAKRIAKHMSYQILCTMPNWEEDMDKLLMTMAISGICFKKTYHDSLSGYHCSSLVYPENFCINYWATSLETAYRKTEILRYTKNEYMEKVNNDEEFLEIDVLPTATNVSAEEQGKEPVLHTTGPSPEDDSTPYVFLACHTYWDLDDDGYEEPYIITVHKDTKKVVKITARWDQDGVYKNDKGKIIKIQPVEYFTAFPFIPNPDGSVYALGFGTLLGPINESVNSIINQLIDSGTLNNLQAGFIGKGLRIKMGKSTFEPGEWKAVNATGDDLHKSIFPLPTKEPSAVLMELLNMLITSGNQLASIAEIFVGKMPGQNTPATTTQETVQQGMAVFTAIYKRVYRALHQEFKKIFRLNRISPDIVAQEAETLKIQLSAPDYDDEDYIEPGADPSGDSKSTTVMKVQAVGQMLQLGTINPMAYTEWALREQEIPNYQKLMQQPPPPPPDPKVQSEQMKQQTMQMKAQTDSEAKQQELEMKKQLAQLDAQMKAMELKFKQQELALKIQGQQQQIQMDQVQQASEMQMEQQQMQHDMQANKIRTQMELSHQDAMQQQELTASKQTHQQDLKQGGEAHKQKMQQQKQQTKMKGATNGSKKK